MANGVKLSGGRFDVDDYVGNLRKLYLEFPLDLLGELVRLDDAHVRRDLEVQVELDGAAHAARTNPVDVAHAAHRAGQGRDAGRVQSGRIDQDGDVVLEDLPGGLPDERHQQQGRHAGTRA